MLFRHTLIAPVVLTSVLLAQNVAEESKWSVRRRLYPELTRVFDLAETAPAPLRALALLTIASSSRLRDVVWKRELIQESFDAAASAPIPWQVEPVAMPDEPLPAMPKRYVRAAHINSGLDRLSLQASAVTAMLAIDPLEARNLFERMVPLRVPALTCPDIFIPTVQVYYKTAGMLATSGFSPQEQIKHKPVDFLRGVILSVASPVEVGAAAQMLLSQQLHPNDLLSLAILYADRLQAMAPDSRAFPASIERAGEQIMKLTNQLVASGQNSVVLKAWRTYLVNNLRSAQCEEAVDPASVYSRRVAKAVQEFNRRLPLDSQVARIASDEIGSKKIERALHSDLLSASEQEGKLSKQWFTLMFGGQKQGLSDEAKTTTEWKTLFSDYLNAVENLRPSSGESTTELLWRKCGLLSQAVLVAPPGIDRDRVIDRYVSLLNVSNLAPEIASEWFGEIQSFLRLSELFSKSGAQISERLIQSGNSLVNLVASMNQIASDGNTH